MKWEKKGLIYAPDNRMPWADNSALTPTPILMDGVIRIYAGFRDCKGISRIGYIDVDADNPKKVLRISRSPVLDVGIPGTFDDNGVILGDVINVGSDLYMYYVGFQLVSKVKFMAYTGLAISHDKGDSFQRYWNTPVLDRCDEALYIRAIHSVIIENGIWKVWYATGSGWEFIDGVNFPQYNIRYIESVDGINFGREGQACIACEGSEYRIGRPRVYHINNGYKMFYTKGTIEKSYMAGYAESSDGRIWTRKDDQLGIQLSNYGWDSKTLCYPSLIQYKDRTYMFYNGNDMGKEGVGYAELTSWY